MDDDIEDIDKLFDKFYNFLNEMNSKEGSLSVEMINLSNDLFETLKIMENCESCRIRHAVVFCEPTINELENYLAELEEEEQEQEKFNMTGRLNDRLFEMNNELNRWVLLLCENCKERKVEKLTDKCEHKEMAR